MGELVPSSDFGQMITSFMLRKEDHLVHITYIIWEIPQGSSEVVVFIT